MELQSTLQVLARTLYPLCCDKAYPFQEIPRHQSIAFAD
jgi:hypothetical protein